ncbi:MAG: 16S rRNA (guanine(527)-N(7))-methyltransferase RsmG [Oscillospiraceae bacterium]|nr:16S rRNA (guanine(527)-N(7))-methyltransferase RsmG [Oscillospiraceae bacterium]
MNAENYDLTVLREGCRGWNLTLTERQEEQLLMYYEKLVETNKVMNLTAITEFEDVVVKHFLDSLSLAAYLPMENISSMIDVGTGAGFPGIPLKILCPEMSLCLLDSLMKRIRFLEETAESLSLKKVTCVHGRAEEAARNKNCREAFDLCVSRAVSNLATLAEYCLPFVKPGGYFVSYKSGDVQEEVEKAEKAISILGGRLEKTEFFCLPGSDIDRSLLFIKKVKKTPAAYPRKAGTPQKVPIM